VTDDRLLALIEEVIRSSVDSAREQQIGPNSRLEEDLGFDSIDLVGVVVSLEDRLQIPIGVEEVRAFRTVADLVTAVRAHVRPEAA
jgi:acyl carrier protein